MKVPLADWKSTYSQRRLVKKVLKSGRLTYGSVTKQLEEQFALIHDWEYSLFTSSGTDALKIALGALKEKYGWKDGDEVIIPAVTFVATMNIVLMNNLIPVLVDVDRTTFNIDPTQIEQAITKKTRAVIPVHLLGQPADMVTIMKLAKRHNLRVIEDSCEMMGIDYAPRGDIACYSTYLAHLLSTGVGGFIATSDSNLTTIMRSMMFHGRDESYLSIDDTTDPNLHYSFPRFGYSDRLTEMEAALGLVELANLQDNIYIRRENACRLYEGIHGDYKILPNHAFMFFPLISSKRDELAHYLQDNGIETRHIMPLTTQPLAKKYLKGRYPNATYINKRGLLLPCHQYLNYKQLNHMIKTVKDFYA